MMQDPAAALACPRCESKNTKFCYYNNYNQAQPRHFCKACRRYWTHGGNLRNVPVGGGTRKKRRPSPSSSSSAATAKRCQLLSSPPATPPPPATVAAAVALPTSRALFPEPISFVFPIDLCFGAGSGSGSSFFSSDAQMGGFVDGLFQPPPATDDAGFTAAEMQSAGVHGGGQQAAAPVLENFLDSNFWAGGGGGWPDLTIYTPSSSGSGF